MTDDFQVDEMSELSDNENETFNLTLEQYLLRTLGPKHLALSTVIPLTVIYVLIFVTGVFGNVSVCAVIIKNASLHTATNYYLFSLAVSDLTLLTLGLPNDLSVYWQQYPWALGKGLCKVRALVSEMVSYTSVLTIVAFSMERYLAICHPLHHYAMSGLKRAVKIIGILWVVSLLAATPFAVFTTVNYLDYPPGSGQKVPESGFCAMLSTNIPPGWPVYEISSLLFFLLPMLVILILYIRMGVAIRERGTDSSFKRVDGLIHKRRHSSSRKTIIRMLAAVVVAFFLCWAPFHAQRLLYLYANDSPNFPEINEWMYHIAGIFYYISSTVNPILYNVMSAKYRLAFKKTLFGFLSPKKYSTESRRFDSLHRFDHYSASLSRKKTLDRSPVTDPGSDSINGETASAVQIERTVDGVNKLVRTHKRNKKTVLNNNNNYTGHGGGGSSSSSSGCHTNNVERYHHRSRCRQKRESSTSENFNCDRKTLERETAKTACGVVVVITPAPNKIYQM